MLFSFYFKYGRPQLQIWSLQKLVVVKVYAAFPVENFTNVRFKGFIGSSRTELEFNIVDFPLAKMDVEIVVVLKKKLIVNPEPEPKDFQKLKLGKINKENRNIMYQRREVEEVVKSMFFLLDKHLYHTTAFNNILVLVAATKSNNADDLKCVMDMIKWYLMFRNTFLNMMMKQFQVQKIHQ
ncbi:unnamed protein product [Lactuca saligna]|uniref:Uncharacterized protein n=1 Tax=Lactuca saligna TaxID=75948 RepID=A0AA35Z9X5_LACSI|nr:unnamed protein product [Lactuca saligna]